MPISVGRATTWLVIMGGDSRFASRLRWWRQRRGMSQLALAHEAEISQRHVSFLERGRTNPSREMVLRLSAALDLPFREQNALLLAAGFAPAWRETPFGAPELALVDRALDYMLIQQEPYPAFVVDRRWQLLRANLAGRSLVRFLTDSPARSQSAHQPCRRAGRARRAPSLDCELARGRAVLPAQRARRRAGRWFRRNCGLARTIARLPRRSRPIGHSRHGGRGRAGRHHAFS